MSFLSSYKKYYFLFTFGFLLLLSGVLYAMRTSQVPQVKLDPSVPPVVIKPIVIEPSVILPGDPIFITVNATSSVREMYFDDQKLSFFVYEGQPRALFGIPFEEIDLVHQVQVVLKNGVVLTKPITLTHRQKIVKTISIPQKLGGNTSAASLAVSQNLAKENAEIAAIKTEPKILWTKGFGDPLEKIFITDNYGYNRNTVDRVIVHKGTDLRAASGTEVMAMNRGVVRIARTYIVYGNTVVIDHGLGVQTLYMHLSKINVKEGQTVKPGQIIGLSGSTGYAEAAHLHVSVKVGGTSIDPMKFLAFW